MQQIVKWIAVILFNHIWSFSIAQTLPPSNIYVLQLENWTETPLHVRKVLYITGSNQRAYNNQPFCKSEQEILFSSHVTSENQVDVFSANFGAGLMTNLTNSRQSEYSPRWNPSTKSIQIVYVNNDKHQVMAEINSEDELNVNLGHIKNVGYYRISGNHIAAFLVDSSTNNLLSLINTKTQANKYFASGIGRCFEFIDPDHIVYVQKNLNNAQLKNYSISTGTAKILCQMPEGVEDFIILQDNTIVCAKGSKVFKLKDTNWIEILDLQKLGIANIKRLAYLGNTLCIVDQL